MGLAAIADELALTWDALTTTALRSASPGMGIAGDTGYLASFGSGTELEVPECERFAEIGRDEVMAAGRHLTDHLPLTWEAISLYVVADALRAYANAPTTDNQTARIELLGLAVCRQLTEHPGEPTALLRALPWDLVNLTDDPRTEVYGLSLEQVASTCCLQALVHTRSFGLAAVHPHRAVRSLGRELLEPLAIATKYIDWRSESTDWLCAPDPIDLIVQARLVELTPAELETMRVLAVNWTGTLGELHTATIQLS